MVNSLSPPPCLQRGSVIPMLSAGLVSLAQRGSRGELAPSHPTAWELSLPPRAGDMASYWCHSQILPSRSCLWSQYVY